MLTTILVLETGRALPTCPTVFTKPGPAVADHGESIPIPSFAQDQCDYEGELVVVIGKDAKNVSEADALDYVAGYTAGNEFPRATGRERLEKQGLFRNGLSASHLTSTRRWVRVLWPLTSWARLTNNR